MMKDRCPSCGMLLLPDEKVCPRCGLAIDPEQMGETPETEPAAEVRTAEPVQETVSKTVPETKCETNAPHMPENFGKQAETGGKTPGAESVTGYNPASGEIPKTIEELKAYCAYHEMQLARMRFFIGEDYKYPRAFGIYRDGDHVVVYKNKASGNRAVRYSGPDEAYGVRELYNKLLEECHARDIWPDGRPQGQGRGMTRRRPNRQKDYFFRIAVVVFIIICILYYGYNHIKHSHDGYYRMNDDGMYYRYGSDWYYSDGIADWYLVSMLMDDGSYDDYYLGEDYDSSWEYGDFYDSQAWADIQAEEESHTSSSDYDSWDSGSTDWDSDW